MIDDDDDDDSFNELRLFYDKRVMVPEAVAIKASRLRMQLTQKLSIILLVLQSIFASVILWRSYQPSRITPQTSGEGQSGSSILIEVDRFSSKHTPHQISLDFGKTIAVSNTTATLQVGTNPLLDKQISPVASSVFEGLRDLQADLVRFVAWYPYPRLGVVELDPPDSVARKTFWKFGPELGQQFRDVWNAVRASQKGRLVLNFSTPPSWMFNTSDWSYPKNAAAVDWGYAKGGWTNATTNLVAGYYARLASWLVAGEFFDEFGERVDGGPSLGLAKDGGVTHWEVLNDPNGEYNLTIAEYNLMYDAIVHAIRKAVDPNNTITFVGLSLVDHTNWEWWREFLDPTNHIPSVRDSLDEGYASFHFHVKTNSRTNMTASAKDVWRQSDLFFGNVDKILQIRNERSPSTKLALNEIAIIPPEDNSDVSPESPALFYNLGAAFFVVVWGELSLKGIDVVGSSQLCTNPAIVEWGIPDAMYPSVTMTNWTTGRGNPRYWALKLLTHFSLGPGDKIVSSRSQASDIYIQGRITAKDQREILIVVNKSSVNQSIRFTDSDSSADDTSYHVYLIDDSMPFGPWKEVIITSTSVEPFLVLRPFAVAVVEVLDSRIQIRSREAPTQIMIDVTHEI